MTVEVAPVRSRRELGEFIELPFRLHSTQPHWIPPLRLERRLDARWFVAVPVV